MLHLFFPPQNYLNVCFWLMLIYNLGAVSANINLYRCIDYKSVSSINTAQIMGDRAKTWILYFLPTK